MNSNLAQAVTSGALYPTTASTVTGTVTNPTNVLQNDTQYAVVSTQDSNLTSYGYSLAAQAISINSITFYWDIASYSGTAGDDIVYFEYSLDSGASWRTGNSYTTTQVKSWAYPHVESFTDNTNIPTTWTQTDISKVRVRLRTVRAKTIDGSVSADVFYIAADYNIADSTPPNWSSTSSLTATATGLSQINLSWTNDATDNIGLSGWEIYRKLSSDTAWPSSPIRTASSTANNYSDTSLASGTSYDYKIRVKDIAGNTSSWSNVAKATTQADTVGPTWNSSESLVALVAAGGKVDLNWNNSATDNVSVTGWEIYRKLNSDTTWPLAPIATAPSNSTSYSDLTVSDKTSYNYRIRAIDGAGNASIWSNIANVVTPDMSPPVVTAVSPANGSTSVLRGALIKITFSKPLNTSTISIGNTLTVHDNTYNAYITTGNLTFEDDNKTVIFDPTNSLSSNATFTAVVSTGVKDVYGNALSSNFSWSFSTGTDVFLSPHGNFLSNDKACGTCHSTHSSKGGNLAKIASVDQLCYLCHDAGGIGSIYTVQNDFDTGKNTSTHKVPGSQHCTECHNPHLANSTTPNLLETANGAHGDEQLCWNCHGKGSQLATDNGNDSAGNANDHQSYYPQDGTGHDSVSFEPVSGTNIKCNKCHEEHGSKFEKLLKDPQGDSPATFALNDKTFCYECHANAIVGADSAWDGKSINDNNKGHANKCIDCHDPHGTPNEEYTKFSYSMTPAGTSRDNATYPYNPEDYNQCWNSCHTAKKATLTQTTKNDGVAPTTFWQEDLYLSNPNDSRVNLHKFHLNLDNYRPGRGNAVCKECHRPHGGLTDENPDLAKKVGFPSSTVTSNSFTKPRYDLLSKDLGDSTDGGSCNLTCHGYTHNNTSYTNGGVDSGPTLPSGGQDCMDSCHGDTLVADMSTSSTLYRHLVKSPKATYDESVAGGQTTCLSLCHTDHDIFNSTIGTSPSPMLRSSGGSTAVAPTSGITVDQTNTLCLSSGCHGTAGPVDDTSYNSPSGFSATSGIGTQVNATTSGFHPINIPLSGGISNSYAKATLVAPWNTVNQLKCTDCHTQEAAPYGTHASSNRYMLRRLGPQAYNAKLGSNLSYQLYDALCVMCHSQSVYGYGRTIGTGVGSKAPNTHKLGKHYTGEFGCMECHGGNPEFAQLAGEPYNSAAERGSIHGWSYTYPGRTHPAEGFQNGLTISDYDPIDNVCTAQTGNSNCTMNAHAIQ